MTKYPVCCEIAGPTAKWTRPDTGDVPVSYPAPTLAAVKGLFESIVWLKSAEVVPTRVELCARLVFQMRASMICGRSLGTGNSQIMTNGQLRHRSLTSSVRPEVELRGIAGKTVRKNHGPTTHVSVDRQYNLRVAGRRVGRQREDREVWSKLSQLHASPAYVELHAYVRRVSAR